MPREWIIFLFFIVIGFELIRAKRHTRKWSFLITAFLLFLLYFTAVVAFQPHDIDFSSPRGIFNAGYIYMTWVGSSIFNLWDAGTDTVSIVGNAIRVNETDF